MCDPIEVPIGEYMGLPPNGALGVSAYRRYVFRIDAEAPRVRSFHRKKVPSCYALSLLFSVNMFVCSLLATKRQQAKFVLVASACDKGRQLFHCAHNKLPLGRSSYLGELRLARSSKNI